MYVISTLTSPRMSSSLRSVAIHLSLTHAHTYCSFHLLNLLFACWLQSGEYCSKVIHYKYHNFQDHRKVEILTTKGIKDLTQLKKKSLLDFPSTEFSKNILPFMEHSRFALDENVTAKPKIDAQVV